jgi:hypothetical protein
VGGMVDELSDWLDGIDMSVSHELVSAYATSSNARPGEVLRDVRRSISAPDVRGEARGRGSLSATEVLHAYLRQLASHYEAGDVDVASEEAAREEVRGVQQDDEPASPPRQRRQARQRAAERPDLVHPLSQVLARHADEAWSSYLRSDAAPLLAKHIPRVATGIPNRVHRLRCLGNAVVPQVVEVIARKVWGG